MKDVGRIVIVGAGPAGLGAADRLRERGYSRFEVIEAADRPGGLAASWTDDRGFTWDCGGHVWFGGTDAYWTRLAALCGPDAFVTGQRDARVWVDGRFVPYPIQQHADKLGVPAAGPRLAPSPRFDAWLKNEFGDGLMQKFFEPYNRKVWGVPLDRLDARAIVNRVAPAKSSIWKHNDQFRYPRGGTGAIWRKVADGLPIRYQQRLSLVDLDFRSVELATDEKVPYDTLISTMPVSVLVRRTLHISDETLGAAAQLTHSGLQVVGLGFQGTPRPELAGVSWWYDPSRFTPFHRATLLSGYAPGMAPDGHWSLMLEVCRGQYSATQADVVAACVKALADAQLIDPSTLVSTWTHQVAFAYPTPTLDRDRLLGPIRFELTKNRIHSIGRFGSWLYELGNMDQCWQQGVDLVDRLLTR